MIDRRRIDSALRQTIAHLDQTGSGLNDSALRAGQSLATAGVALNGSRESLAELLETGERLQVAVQGNLIAARVAMGGLQPRVDRLEHHVANSRRSFARIQASVDTRARTLAQRLNVGLIFIVLIILAGVVGQLLLK